jgi:hypothetical protein
MMTAGGVEGAPLFTGPLALTTIYPLPPLQIPQRII